MAIIYHPEQSLTTPVNATFPKNQALGMALLLPNTLVSLVLDFTQMVLAVRKHLEMAIKYHPEQSWTTLINAIFPKIHSLGKSLLLPYTWVS